MHLSHDPDVPDSCSQIGFVSIKKLSCFYSLEDLRIASGLLGVFIPKFLSKEGGSP